MMEEDSKAYESTSSSPQYEWWQSFYAHAIFSSSLRDLIYWSKVIWPYVPSSSPSYYFIKFLKSETCPTWLPPCNHSVPRGCCKWVAIVYKASYPFNAPPYTTLKSIAFLHINTDGPYTNLWCSYHPTWFNVPNTTTALSSSHFPFTNVKAYFTYLCVEEFWWHYHVL